jgi:hypothetical protein
VALLSNFIGQPSVATTAVVADGSVGFPDGAEIFVRQIFVIKTLRYVEDLCVFLNVPNSSL